MSLVSISSSSEILSTVVRYSITLVSRSGRREISKMCSMYDRLSAWEVLLIGSVHWKGLKFMSDMFNRLFLSALDVESSVSLCLSP